MTIRFENITKVFGKVTALDDITLDVKDGDLMFLLGPSGCGKTTLLRCLAGFETPTSGRILVESEDIGSQPPHKRNTAMVFQGYALWPHMTVRENVAFGLDMRPMTKAEREAKTRRALEIVRIPELAERKPNELSGGQQQRVALARTLVVEPGCLLLDEPLANLDAKLRRDMRSEIRRVCKESGLTALYVTHDREEALSMADRVALLKNGRLLQTGRPRDLYLRPKTQFVASFIGETNFVPATVKDRIGQCTSLDTIFGMLISTVQSPHADVGEEVVLSLRPEALALKKGDENTFNATLVETTYLGELAEHVVNVHDGLALTVFEMNPHDPIPAGQRVSLTIDSDDIVILPKAVRG